MFKDIQNPGLFSYETGDSALSIDTLPSEFRVIFSDCENGVIMFNPNGSSSFNGGGNFWMLGYGERTSAYFQINVLPSTGRVESESQYGEGHT